MDNRIEAMATEGAPSDCEYRMKILAVDIAATAATIASGSILGTESRGRILAVYFVESLRVGVWTVSHSWLDRECSG